MWFVYVIESVSAPRLYVGITTNIRKRLASHNRGKTKSTKHWIPWKIRHIEQYEDRQEAVAREKFLKTGVGREYLNNLS